MKLLLAGVVVLSLLCCTRNAAVAPVNTTSEGVAIKGYDRVAYFTSKRPVHGIPEFEYVWRGARWRFASAANRQAFSRNPKDYAPRYGGYCAYAVSQGKTADIDPEAWTVFEGKLYLNLNRNVQKLWEKNMQSYIRLADRNWPLMIGHTHPDFQN
ncbi:MAG TPA: YHS domain-containing (seleno)protein [Dissulfurispiraceae bacterium]|nr:YHS domain-containing (seleno)protein [Dissulfurispiraceae bacterium]